MMIGVKEWYAPSKWKVVRVVGKGLTDRQHYRKI